MDDLPGILSGNPSCGKQTSICEGISSTPILVTDVYGFNQLSFEGVTLFPRKSNV